MKILNAIHAQTVGGVDQMFRNYSKILLNNNHEVSLLISDNGNDSYDNLNVKKIFKLKNKTQIFDFLKLFFIILTYKPDIVICHSNRLMRWLGILKYLCLTKSVAVNHGITFKKSLYCDYVISINEQITQMVVAEGFDAKKAFTLANVIEIEDKYFQKQIKTIPVIGIYGRLEKRKGFDILIKAAAILREKNFDFRLKIGGFEVDENYNFNYLKKLAQENKVLDKCEFVGIVTDKKDFFKDVDIFCVPSIEEPFGLVILESFAQSTLVISSDTEGGKLLINNNVDGLLFENGDAQDLADKIISAKISEEKYCDFTGKAYAKLVAKYSFKEMAKNFEKILQIIS